MRLSDKGVSLLKELEAVRTHIYKDQAGLPTIGVGHLLSRDEIYSGKINVLGKYIRYKDGLTLAQVDQLLTLDLGRFERDVDTFVHVKLLQNQFDALVIFSFNVGVQAFNGSTLLKMLNNSQYDAVPHQLRRWIYAAGQVSDGLKNRRERTIQHWLSNQTAAVPPKERRQRGFDIKYVTDDNNYSVTITEEIGRLGVSLTGNWHIK